MNPFLSSSLPDHSPLFQFRFCAPLIQDLKPQVLWIECYKGMQVPSFQVVGLPGPEISEARERIRAAVESSGLEFPEQKVLINLSPANVKKQGTGLDLSMALSVLLTEASKDLQSQSPTVSALPIQTVCAWGELSLNGELKNSGHEFRALLSALHSHADVLVLPRECQQRVTENQEHLDFLNVSEDRSDLPENHTLQLLRRRGWPRIVFAANLAEAHLDLWTNGQSTQQAQAYPAEMSIRPQTSSHSGAPQIEVGGAPSPQPQLLPLSPSLERVLGVSLSGAHHLLLLGARGAGKSQAFEWVPHLLPRPSSDSQIHNRLAMENQADAPTLPWIRRVGQQVKAAALVGGINSRSAVRPGEFTLAHGGVLLADEFPEWSRDARESLREPLERGRVSLTRANGSIELPAQFIFLGNGNLCPCGGVPKEWSSLQARLRREIVSSSCGSERESLSEIQTPLCRCTELEQQRYRARLSGPVLDRMDLVVRVVPEFQRNKGHSLSLESFTKKIRTVRSELELKYGGLPGNLSGSQLEFVLSQLPHFQQALTEVQFSSLRSRHKCARVALTLAAWEDTALEPGIAHLHEAQFYRSESTLMDAH